MIWPPCRRRQSRGHGSAMGVVLFWASLLRGLCKSDAVRELLVLACLTVSEQYPRRICPSTRTHHALTYVWVSITGHVARAALVLRHQGQMHFLKRSGNIPGQLVHLSERVFSFFIMKEGSR